MLPDLKVMGSPDLESKTLKPQAKGDLDSPFKVVFVCVCVCVCVCTSQTSSYRQVFRADGKEGLCKQLKCY